MKKGTRRASFRSGFHTRSGAKQKRVASFNGANWAWAEALESRRMLTLAVPAYSSLPGAPHTLYLNFGGSAPFSWNNGTQYQVHGPGGLNTPIPPFDWDGN
jgi:hypothetical protein